MEKVAYCSCGDEAFHTEDDVICHAINHGIDISTRLTEDIFHLWPRGPLPGDFQVQLNTGYY